ncbi:sensor histidine kinase [Embleya scabrispora]|uniref:sensor histidine kinase n=1 Tax=Embleya scabrispora TaxID=159449 RepID=UPI000364946F|nr:histidine kinase [Embleya scabrispora]MYS86676.1 histidine kinase [Streptomyces sp. SID5474]
MTAALAASRSEGILDAGTLAWFDVLVLAVAIGDTTRSRRAYPATLHDRAEHAERTREDEAARRVAAERVRIARDLHDVVAHHITQVNAQTGVARHLVLTDPEAAHQALGQPKDTSRAALDELRATVGLLRKEGGAHPRTPSPTPADLDDLAESFRRTGLPIEITVTGTPRPATPSVELAAFRITQEALTNTAEHAGPATAHPAPVGAGRRESRSRAGSCVSAVPGRRPPRAAAKAPRAGQPVPKARAKPLAQWSRSVDH